jgi:hypothetical protein
MRTRIRWIWGLCLTAAVTGCATTQPPRSQLLEKFGNGSMTLTEVRSHTQALAAEFSGDMEDLSNALFPRTGDPQERVRILRFKSNAVTQIQKAFLRQDPVAALIDGWALLEQMDLYLDTLGNSPAEVQLETLARAKFSQMRQRLEQLGRQITGKSDLSIARGRIRAWAAANPLRGSLDARPSPEPLLAAEEELSGQPPLRFLTSAVEQMQDLLDRSQLPAQYLPKQVSWQTDALVRELLTDPTALSSRNAEGSIGGAVASLLRLSESMPVLIDRERSAMTQALNVQRLEVQGFVESERKAVTAQLESEGQRVFESIEQERREVTRDAQQIVNGAVDRAFDRVERLMLIALVGLGALVCVGIVVFQLTRGTWHRGEPEPRRRDEGTDRRIPRTT